MFKLLQRMIGRKTLGAGSSSGTNEPEQAILIYLDGQSLDEDVYQTCDIATLEDLLIKQIESLDHVGELDGNETGPEGTTLYLYGPDAERLFEAIRPVLVSYPLCQNSRAVIRQGGPGASQREVTFPGS